MKLPHITKNTLSLEGCKLNDLPQEVLNSSRPIILKGLVNDWPITQIARQSKGQLKQYISAFYTGRPVTTMHAPAHTQGRYFYNDGCDGFNFSRDHGSLLEVLNHACEAGSESYKDDSYKYAGSVALDNYLPGLSEENNLCLDALSPLRSIWIGNKSRISCHFDVPQNMACCVAGKRYFTLFPPDQISNLYVGPLDITPAGQSISLVDFHQPDYQRFPRFKEALSNAEFAALEPGDALLLPSMWWHHVESLNDFNVLINYWWHNQPPYMGRGLDALNNAMLSIRDLPTEQKRAWQALFEHYIFGDYETMNGHIPESARSLLAPLDDTNARAIRTQLLRNLNR